MARPLSATALVSALRAEGCKVVEVRDWRDHNRNHKGAWGPVHGVMLHHTVTSGTQRSIDIIYDGYSSLPGPLSQGFISKNGTVYMTGNGRCNHAGLGDDDVLSAVIAENALPSPNENNTDGNARFYGFECENLGNNKDPWPTAQVDAMIRASAAVCRAHEWGRDGDTSVIGHKEWTNTKVDPRGPLAAGGWLSMNRIRAQVAERLRHPASWNPEEDDVALTNDDVNKVANAVVEALTGTTAGRRKLVAAIFRTDDVIDSPLKDQDPGGNAHWWGQSYLREEYLRTMELQGSVTDLHTKVDSLAVGGVDLDALAAKVADLLAARLTD